MSTAPIGIGRRVKQALAVVVVAAGAALVVPATEASAATARNGVCESGEFCLYYFDNRGGSVSDFSNTNSIPNHGLTQPSCYEFRGSGSGQEDCIGRNAWSAWNRTHRAVRVYTGTSYTGSSQLFAAGQVANFSGTLRDNNLSHKLL